MAHIVLFHHAQGLTTGLKQTIAQFISAGHTVTAPDMFDGLTFATVNEGVAHVESIGFDKVFAHARELILSQEPLPQDVPHVYIGYSMGAVPAAQHALEDPEAKVLILMHAAVDPAWFEHAWNPTLRIQVHAAKEDPWMEFDALDALRAAHGSPVEALLCPGSAHLYTDSSVTEFAPADAAAAYEKVFQLLNELA